jgi:enamine deaminase RidA (YjgF/YER057c/UK114 family)
MPEKVSIWVENAPTPLSHNCQVMKYGNSLHFSGQLPLDAKSMQLVGSDPALQMRTVFNHLGECVQACGGQMSHVLKITLYLTDLADVAAYDKIAKEVFFFLPPALTVVQVAGLPKGARVCLDAFAEIKPPEGPGTKVL